MAAVVLIIEDEMEIRRFLRVTLVAHDFKSIEASTGAEGLRLAATQNPNLIILDLNLPDMDGLAVTEQLRTWSKTPIIVLSARLQEHDKIAALDAGADDYLTKPFGTGELMARIRVAMRHVGNAPSAEGAAVFVSGDLRIDRSTRQVFVSEREIHLTPIQYKLLTLMAEHAGKVLTHQHLLKEAWGAEYVKESHYLRVYMGQLRRKIEADPTRPRYILNEPGVGYRLATQPHSQP